MTRNDVVLNGALAWCSWPNSESNGLRAASCWAFTGCCCSFAGRAAGLDLRDSGAEDGTRRGVNCCVRASTLPPFVVHVAPSLNMEVPLQVPVLASVGLLAKSWARSFDGVSQIAALPFLRTAPPPRSSSCGGAAVASSPRCSWRSLCGDGLEQLEQAPPVQAVAALWPAAKGNGTSCWQGASCTGCLNSQACRTPRCGPLVEGWTPGRAPNLGVSPSERSRHFFTTAGTGCPCARFGLKPARCGSPAAWATCALFGSLPSCVAARRGVGCLVDEGSA